MVSIINSAFITFIKLLPRSLVSIFAKQYVAGEHADDVLKVTKKLNDSGYRVTVDILGEHFSDQNEIENIISEYSLLYKLIEKNKLDANISIKPTHIGLDVSYDYCLNSFKNILKTAEKYNNFLRIDMESSKATDDTIKIYGELAENSFNVGPVFQAYLNRTYSDIQNIENKEKLNFRLCKGIYKESPDIAIADYYEVNKNYLKILEYAFQNNIYIGIATHDKTLIDQCYELIRKYNVDPEMFEFQVLYGVPMDDYLKKHRKNNYNVRVYVPYGKQWYEYSIRRIKENPNILLYVLKNLFKQ